MLRDVQKLEAKIIPMYPDGVFTRLSSARRAEERRFLFWQHWLFYSSLFFAFAGVILSIDGNNVLANAYNAMLARVFWGVQTFPPQVESFREFVLGPLGGTMTAFYLLVAAVAWFPFRKKELWARNTLVIAFFTWAFIDTAICLYHGVYLQAFFGQWYLYFSESPSTNIYVGRV